MIGNKKLLKPQTVAVMLDISYDTVYRLIRQGDLKFIKTSPRNIRILESDLDEYLKKINPDKNFKLQQEVA